MSAETTASLGAGVTTPSNLSGQFALTGGMVMLVVMTLAGMMTSTIVSNATVDNSAASTALFMDNFLSPHLQSLADSDVLPVSSVDALNRLLGVETEQEEPFERRFPHLEIWKKGGLVAYSSSPELIGRWFDPPRGLAEAMAGEVSAQYADLGAREHVERHFESEYLEIYIPVREYLSERIIAVAEIHEKPDLLQRRLFEVRARSWLTTAGLTLVVMLSLFGIVHRGSRLINAQHAALKQRIDEVRRVSDQNRKLREKAQLASSRLTELNASYLRNVGAELHDGPAQLIGLAALKVEHVRQAKTAAGRRLELQAIDAILADALRDIRAVSKGLMLPEIEDLPLCEVVARAVGLHEKRTDTKVALTCGQLDCDASHAVKICVYRFVQEGLSNAFRHASRDGQSVSCQLVASLLHVSVRDQGGGSGGRGHMRREAGLGLTGLRARVESLGGTFFSITDPAVGTRLEMTLAIMETSDG